MDAEVKRHKRRVRIGAFLGILPGIWFVVSTQTQIGERLQIGCGYWMIMLTILAVVWVAYAIFTKLIMRDISAAHDHAHSLTEQRYYKMAYASTFIEAIIASAIMALSMIGFIATDLRCFISERLAI